MESQDNHKIEYQHECGDEDEVSRSGLGYSSALKPTFFTAVFLAQLDGCPARGAVVVFGKNRSFFTSIFRQSDPWRLL